MDEHKFDDFIKNKIGEYEDPNFDPSALENLQQRMAGFVVTPWYIRYRTALWVSSALILFTLINFYIQWSVGNTNYQALQKELATLRTENQEMEALRNKLNILENTHPDTVRIIEVKEISPFPAPASTNNMYPFLQQGRSSLQGKQLLYLGVNEDIPEAILLQLMQAGFIKKEGEHTYLIMPADIPPLSPKPLEMDMKTSERPALTFYHGRKNDREEKSAKRGLSPKTLRSLEKHYGKGIGINAGPVVDISTGFYQAGHSDIALGGGMLAELVLSPALSLETGVKYMQRSYEIDDPDELQTVALPSVDETLGNLITAEIDSRMLEFPLNLKYRQPISSKTHWVVSAGYAALLFVRQDFEYSYSLETDTGQGEDEISFSINSFERKDEIQFYPGNLNLSVGISNQLKNNNTLQLDIYYQHSLGDTGEEMIRPGFLGLRGVYWLNIR